MASADRSKPKIVEHRDPAYGRTKWSLEGEPKSKQGGGKGKEQDKERADELLELPNERTEYLQARKHDLKLEDKIGKTYIIPKQDLGKAKSPFYCDICDVNFNDNSTFVDHLNGKKHNRMLGMNMKVKSGTVEGVLAKLEFGAILAGHKSKPNVQIVDKATPVVALGKRGGDWAEVEEEGDSEEGGEEDGSEQSGEEEEPDELELQMKQLGMPTKFH